VQLELEASESTHQEVLVHNVLESEFVRPNYMTLWGLSVWEHLYVPQHWLRFVSRGEVVYALRIDEPRITVDMYTSKSGSETLTEVLRTIQKLRTDGMEPEAILMNMKLIPEDVEEEDLLDGVTISVDRPVTETGLFSPCYTAGHHTTLTVEGLNEKVQPFIDVVWALAHSVLDLKSGKG